MTHAQADIALSLLNSGKYLETSNMIAEDIFFDLWESPNFHTSDTDETLTEWPVTGYHYDVLIGGQWPGMQTEWDDGLHGYTMVRTYRSYLLTTKCLFLLLLLS